jgi:hemerythrin-like domain-containing protein
MIQVGAGKLSTFSDPLGVLRDCHRRIERFLEVLTTVAERAKDGALDDASREALEVALQYFREAAPKHTADEEVSLFPRLRASHAEHTPEACAIIAPLEVDHEVARAAHVTVEELGARWLTAAHLPPVAIAAFAWNVRHLAGLYKPHIAVEDEILFPLARTLLAPADLVAIGQEMAERRGVHPGPGALQRRDRG